MGILSLVSTVIYVATFFTLLLAIFSYIAFKLRDLRGKRAKGESAQKIQKVNNPLRVHLLNEDQLVGVLKSYNNFGLQLTLADGRDITVWKNAILYYEEIDHQNGSLSSENGTANESTPRDRRSSERVSTPGGRGLLANNGHGQVHVEVLDMSAEGIAFKTNRKVQVNSIYAMELFLQPPFGHMVAHVKVVHVEELPDGGVRVGGQFIKDAPDRSD